MTVERELLEALVALRLARDAMNAEAFVVAREVICHEIARADMSVGRALHLLAGSLPEGGPRDS